VQTWRKKTKHLETFDDKGIEEVYGDIGQNCWGGIGKESDKRGAL
jgi:hypothetical protein